MVMDADIINFKTPTMWETWVWSLGWEDPLEKGRLPTPVFCPGEFHGLYNSWDHRVGHKLTDLHTYTVFANVFWMRWHSFPWEWYPLPPKPGPSLVTHVYYDGQFVVHWSVCTSFNHIHTLIFNYSTCFRDAWLIFFISLDFLHLLNTHLTNTC